MFRLRTSLLKLTLNGIIITILSITGSACTLKNEVLESLLLAPEVDTVHTASLIFDRKLEIDGQLLRPYLLNDRYLYGFQSRASNVISCFDLVQDIHLYDINVQDSTLIGQGISSFYPHSGDSLFFQVSNFQIIILIDSLGRKVNQWELKFQNPFIFGSFLPEHSPTYNSKTRELYSTLIPKGYFDMLGFESYSLQMAFNILENRVSSQFAPSEGVMRYKGEGFYPPDISVPYLLNADDKLIVSYPMDHFIYVYGAENKVLEYKRLVSSNSARDFPMPLTENEKNPQEIWNFRIQTPWYEPLFYHEKVKLYTRAVHHWQELKMDDGTLNDDSNRTTSVIILDQNMNVVGETIFMNGNYPTHGAVPLSDGLLIYPKNKKFPTLKYKLEVSRSD